MSVLSSVKEKRVINARNQQNHLSEAFVTVFWKIVAKLTNFRNPSLGLDHSGLVSFEKVSVLEAANSAKSLMSMLRSTLTLSVMRCFNAILIWKIGIANREGQCKYGFTASFWQWLICKNRLSDTVGWARATEAGGLVSVGSYRTLEKRYSRLTVSCLVLGDDGWVQGNGSYAVLPLTRHQFSIHDENSRVDHGASKRR